jgi:hypothetical protein
MAESTATVASLASAILFVAAACSSVGQDPHKLGNIAITERGADAGGEFCKDFSMTPAQGSAFFSRAHLADGPELHGSFDHLPCYVRGTGVWEGQRATWEIRAGGTGMLTVNAMTPRLYGCSDCDDLFGQGK